MLKRYISTFAICLAVTSTPVMAQDVSEQEGANALLGAILTDFLLEGGLIERQEDVARGLLLMDRQIRHAQAANRLLALLGPDLPIETTPGNFERLADLPMGLQARLTELNVKRELVAGQDALLASQKRYDEMRAGFSRIINEDYQEALEDELSRADLFSRINEDVREINAQAVQAEQSLIENAESYREIIEENLQINIEQIETDARQTIEQIETLADEEFSDLEAQIAAIEQELEELESRPEQVQDQVREFIPFFVDSIEAHGGRTSAVISRAGQLVRVNVGDQLPDGVTISRISARGIRFNFDGEERHVEF